ncbi:uncharacterized protein Tco025E_06841 [Trypanosoma conorhini]|uniref:Uncharacterized protein n=1 Tax=Trypanosoma conorhini TaxID=83891 RepID=A0A422NX62_9TRYP|nr:uncharacterized protein Tco025E_06841 [Trypanosoma conorhini]RNF10122.1 hypothetical protein Tco025E_06841 [Trypanosoma conorhini]
MAYFTVHYGNNEAMMFNAECSVGALVDRMLELLAPHTAGYTRLELLPINFVLEQFRPPAGLGASARGGQPPHEAGNDAAAAPSASALKSPPFTGAIPFVGLATRAVESYADAVLGGATAAALPPSTPAVSPSPSAGGASASAAAAAACGGGPTAPSPALQSSYVLLGCRHHPYHHPPLPPATTTAAAARERTGTAVALGLAAPTSAGNRAASAATRRTRASDAVATPQQIATLHRAQVVAAAPIVAAPASRGSICSNAAGSWTAAPAQGSAPSVDPATLLLYNNGLALGGAGTAAWRRNFSHYLTTLLLPQAGEATTATTTTTTTTAPPCDAERQRATLTETANSHSESAPVDSAVLLPAAATGLFKTPAPPITNYDVLWRGPRGEHIRLQEALDERVFTDIDTKKKKPKKS